MKKLLYLLCVVVVSGLCNSSAQALTPIGVPAATLDKGQFAAGFGYSHSNFDLEVSALGITVIAEDQEIDTYMANLIFGLDEKWELQIDLGASVIDVEGMGNKGDFAGGFVLRSTFAQDDKTKWGVASSAHWYETSGGGVYLGVPWTEENKWMEIQIAVGPSYSDKRFCLYGGALLHFIDGEGKATIDGFPFTGDFKQDSIFGGFVGAQIEVAKNTYLGFDYMMTGSAQAIGARILWKF